MLAGGALLGFGTTTLLLGLLTLIYVCSGWMMRHSKDRNSYSKTGAAKTFNEVIKQSRSSLPIICSFSINTHIQHFCPTLSGVTSTGAVGKIWNW